MDSNFSKKSTFTLNWSFFKHLSFEQPVKFVQPTGSDVDEFEVQKWKYSNLSEFILKNSIT